MRIAISGSAGVGKTTLANALAVELGCPVIDEWYETFFQGSGDFIEPRQRLQDEIKTVLLRKHQMVEMQTTCVVDRSPVDLFNLWLTRGFALEHRATQELNNLCRQHLHIYDWIVVLPWAAIPLRQIDDPDTPRQRITNPWVQFWNHSTVIGLLQQWVASNKLLPIPHAVKDIDSRVALVVSAVQDNGDNADRLPT